MIIRWHPSSRQRQLITCDAHQVADPFSNEQYNCSLHALLRRDARAMKRMNQGR
jgi:hypothetical protein